MHPSSAPWLSVLILCATVHCGEGGRIADAGQGSEEEAGTFAEDLPRVALDAGLGAADLGGGAEDAASADSASQAAEAGDEASDLGRSACAVPPSFGSPSLARPSATGEGGASGRVNLEAYGALSEGEPAHRLAILLYGGSGALEEVISPGTYPIAGPELNFSTCGVCIFLDANVVGTGTPEEIYFATGGVLVIAEIGANFRATVRDLTFERVTLETVPPYRSVPAGDGCRTRIDLASFDVAINR